jgi:hypothetical protein
MLPSLKNFYHKNSIRSTTGTSLKRRACYAKVKRFLIVLLVGEYDESKKDARCTKTLAAQKSRHIINDVPAALN